MTLVMAYLNGIFIPHLLCMRTLVAKIVGTTCGILSSLAVGPEGPMVHIGAAVASVMTTPFLTGSFADELREANRRGRDQRPPRWFSRCATCHHLHADIYVSTICIHSLRDEHTAHSSGSTYGDVSLPVEATRLFVIRELVGPCGLPVLARGSLRCTGGVRLRS